MELTVEREVIVEVDVVVTMVVVGLVTTVGEMLVTVSVVSEGTTLVGRKVSVVLVVAWVEPGPTRSKEIETAASRTDTIIIDIKSTG